MAQNYVWPCRDLNMNHFLNVPEMTLLLKIIFIFFLGGSPVNKRLSVFFQHF